MTSVDRCDAPVAPAVVAPAGRTDEQTGRGGRWPLAILVPSAVIAISALGGGTYLLTHAESSPDTTSPVVVSTTSHPALRSSSWDVADPAAPQRPQTSPTAVPHPAPAQRTS